MPGRRSHKKPVSARNYIREEVDRLEWPEIVDDSASDLEREMRRLRNRKNIWRAAATALLWGYVLHYLQSWGLF